MTIQSDFYDRYDAVMARWPVPYTSIDLEGRFGTTHVNVCGVPDGPPVVLLPGGRSTSAVWYANVGALADTHRIYAIDLLGDAGRSVLTGPMKGLPDAMAWLDETLDGLGIDAAAVAGHSYGAFLATRFAIHAPERVSRLILVDPTVSLSPLSLRYKLRAIRLTVSRGRDRFRSFNRWETRGRPIDREFLDLWAGPRGDSGPGDGVFVWPKPPSPDELARLTMPVLVFAATASRQSDAKGLMRGAQRLADVRVVTIEDATHFTVPQQHPDEINPAMAEFLS